MRNVDCQVGYGYNGGERSEDYLGKISHTDGGKLCQRWNSQSPHTHGFVDSEEDYCRNPEKKGQPDPEDGVWCYTLDKNKRWDFCPVRRCSSCDTGYLDTCCRE